MTELASGGPRLTGWRRTSGVWRPCLGTLLACVLAGCATTRQTLPAELVSSGSGATRGYLAPAALPDSLALLPAPPAAGSAAAAADSEGSAAGLAERGSARWLQATHDAELGFPQAPQAFSCAAGLAIDPAVAPHLVALLARSLIDAGAATAAAKDHYHRARPFMVNGEGTCTPDAEARLRTSGSYPSGHSAIGWTWALILAELVPDRADAILARGRAFGDSRVVCNAHWPSDVAEGRVLGAAVVARLHADAAFRADLKASGSDIAHARTLPAGSLAPCDATSFAP